MLFRNNLSLCLQLKWIHWACFPITWSLKSTNSWLDFIFSRTSLISICRHPRFFHSSRHSLFKILCIVKIREITCSVKWFVQFLLFYSGRPRSSKIFSELSRSFLCVKFPKLSLSSSHRIIWRSLLNKSSRISLRKSILFRH